MIPPADMTQIDQYELPQLTRHMKGLRLGNEASGHRHGSQDVINSDGMLVARFYRETLEAARAEAKRWIESNSPIDRERHDFGADELEREGRDVYAEMDDRDSHPRGFGGGER